MRREIGLSGRGTIQIGLLYRNVLRPGGDRRNRPFIRLRFNLKRIDAVIRSGGVMRRKGLGDQLADRSADGGRQRLPEALTEVLPRQRRTGGRGRQCCGRPRQNRARF